MSKEEVIVALNAMLEQGNQLRASKLIPVLVEIVNSIPEGGGNEPYIVQGAITENVEAHSVLIVPEDEYARAKEAFLAGRIVFIPKVDHIAYIVTGYADDIIGSREGLCLYARSSTEFSAEGACYALLPESPESEE